MMVPVTNSDNQLSDDPFEFSGDYFEEQLKQTSDRIFDFDLRCHFGVLFGLINAIS
jgi:hypothetical protein